MRCRLGTDEVRQPIDVLGSIRSSSRNDLAGIVRYGFERLLNGSQSWTGTTLGESESQREGKGELFHASCIVRKNGTLRTFRNRSVPLRMNELLVALNECP